MSIQVFPFRIPQLLLQFILKYVKVQFYACPARFSKDAELCDY